MGSTLVPVSGSWDLEDVSYKVQFAEAGFIDSVYKDTALPKVGTQYYLRCVYSSASTFNPSTETAATFEQFHENVVKMQVNNYAKYL